MENLKDVMEQWENNPDFRKKFTQNPAAALASVGITLSNDDLKKIIRMLKLKDKDNIDLENKINK